MSFPPYSYTPPSLTADQFYYQGPPGSYELTMGYGTPFYLKEIDGLDKPNMRSGNTSRPRFRGSYVGLNLLDTRKITLTMDVGPPFGALTDLPGALAALVATCSTEGTTEYPLWLQVKNFEFVATMCRVIKRTANYDLTADLGSLVAGVSLQFEATDPALYAVTLSNDFTESVALSTIGDLPCYPITTITGLATNPTTITNTTITGSPALSFDIALSSGDTIVIDHDLQSVTYTPSGMSGVNGLYLLAPGSTFWSLPPGVNDLTVSNDAAINIQYASAFSGLL